MARTMSLDTLADEHKQLLRNTWNLISPTKESMAVKIFQMIFEQSPEAKELFYFSKKDSNSKIINNKEFRFHALRFIQVLETTVRNLDSPKVLDPIVVNLGHIHARLKAQRGFDPYFWAVFIECTLHHFRKHLQKVSECEEELDLSIIVWRIVLRSLIDRMKHSYNQKISMNAKMDGRKLSVPAFAHLAKGRSAPTSPEDSKPQFSQSFSHDV